MDVYTARDLRNRSGKLTIAQGAKLAGVDIYDFMDLLSEMGINAVNYPAEDLDWEKLHKR